MEARQHYSNWVEIDLEAVRGNLRAIRRQTGVQVMAVVKANAYGHGALPVARAALEAGATWLGVARIEEALELRRGGLAGSILLLGHTPAERYAEAIAEQLSLTIWDSEQARQASAAATQVGKAARVHLKVDSGMGRLGVQPEDALEMARYLTSREGLYLEGVFTHFARADEADPAPTDLQERRFREALQALESAGIHPELAHAANSAASLAYPSAGFNLARAGIAIYGLHPSSQRPLSTEFRPALTWKAVLSQVKTLPAGLGVSYGHTYVTTAAERIGTIPVGYADGYRRVSGNQALVAGQRAPVVGRVCMDQIMVQLDAIPGARVGDEVVLIGRQGVESIWAEEVAQRWGTINYEVTCGIAARVPRLMI